MTQKSFRVSGLFSILTPLQFSLFSFWYLSLFPGRLGYDYSELTRMVQNDESTAWWGATFFWVFRFLTFDGSHIFLMSLLGLSTLTYSLKYFITAAISDPVHQRRLLSIIMATPLYGVFGVNVSHDVFQSAGIILLTAVIINLRVREVMAGIYEKVAAGIGLLALTTTQPGAMISLAFIVYIFLIRFRKEALVTFFLLILTLFASNLGIDESGRMNSLSKNLLPRLMLVDLKCIVQHPEAGVTEAEWVVLERYASRADWLQPVSCSNPDVLAEPLKLRNKSLVLSRDLTRTFITLVSRNPAIPVMSHIQRSRVALPPPFFQPPTNMVSWDITQPVGLGTNVALQQGPGLLHPSIDEPSVAYRPSLLKSLEPIAQAPTLIINQASWFWGWGGLWLWPLILFLLRRLQIQTIKKLLQTTFPTFMLHLIIFIVGPSSLGRYVMSTVLMGMVALLILFIPKRSS